MAGRIGRPKSDNSKDFLLRVRLDKETLKKLDWCCDLERLTRSEIVRKGINERYERSKE